MRPDCPGAISSPSRGRTRSRRSTSRIARMPSPPMCSARPLMCWTARSSDLGLDPEPYLQRAFPAIWEQQLNLGDAEVITRLADAAGLPGRDLVAKSGSDAVAAVYEQNRQDAIAADVFGSPAYVLDGEIF